LKVIDLTRLISTCPAPPRLRVNFFLIRLYHIREVRPEALEDDGAEDEDGAGDQPEIEGHHVVPFPEPDMVDEALPVAFDNVIDRIQLDHVQILHRQDLRRPEDGGHPEKELDDHADDLPHVAEEEDDGGGEPGEPEEEDNGGE